MLLELDQWLSLKNKRITLHVIGGYALELKNIQRGFSTEDIDSILDIKETDIVEKIHSIGKKYSNPNWFDFGAPSLIVPFGYEKRMEHKIIYENIDLYVLGNADLVKMKVAAYHSRRERGIYRDLEDLIKLNPSTEDIEESIKFYYEEYSKDLSGKYKEEFKSDLKDLKNELIKKCCL